ncbi:MAG: tetratricopeptide repeat protein [Bacteroidaceae bacterium]|nr:tetratricopeptide repeat protein [Bacteroidaceae bacterium]
MHSKTTKRYILAALTLCMSCLAWGQNQTQARKWFAEGEYAKAKPVFAKLLKSNPKSGSLNYWYGVCLNETGEHEKALTYLEKAVDSDVENAYRYIGDYFLADGNFEEAIEHYEEYLEKVEPTDSMFVIYTRRSEKAKHELKFYKRVEKVTFVDSVVVAKNKFLEAYKLGKECGEVKFSRNILESASSEGTAYRTEMRDKIYYSDVDGYGVMQLYMCYKMLDDWSKPALMDGFPEGDNAYPYVLSDGLTIYFANNNPNGVGGYDIYVTRYNSTTDRYLMPQNVGMPFNSPANDYMMIIDEVNKLGWFATDRNQPEDMVCVYTFIPNETKQYYKYGEDNFEDIRNAAQIHSIAATQTDLQAVDKATQTLFRLGLNLQNEEKKRDFTFVIDDFTDYHSLDDFKSSEARQLYIDWQKKQVELDKLANELNDKRGRYTRSSNSERNKMTDELLQLEQQYEKLESEVMGMPMAIRNLEINYIRK